MCVVQNKWAALSASDQSGKETFLVWGASARPSSRARFVIMYPANLCRSMIGAEKSFSVRGGSPPGRCREGFFQRAFKSQGRLPRAITLDGYQASHRAAREFLAEHRGGARTELTQCGVGLHRRTIDVNAFAFTKPRSATRFRTNAKTF